MLLLMLIATAYFVPMAHVIPSIKLLLMMMVMLVQVMMMVCVGIGFPFHRVGRRALGTGHR